jgi:hypothetical protein
MSARLLRYAYATTCCTANTVELTVCTMRAFPLRKPCYTPRCNHGGALTTTALAGQLPAVRANTFAPTGAGFPSASQRFVPQFK